MDGWPPKLIETLSANYQLIIPDNRGMGFSTVNQAPFTCKLFADDIISLMDVLGVKKANVLGLSLGSTVAQELLLEYPQRIDKAIIYATALDGSHMATILSKKNPNDETVARQLEATARWKTPLDKVPLVTNQVMFVVGTADPVAGVESSKKLAATVPGAWLIQIKQGKHPLTNSVPDEFANIALTFLNANETPTAKLTAK